MARSNAKMSRWFTQIGSAALTASLLTAQAARAEEDGTAAESVELTIDRARIASAVTIERASSPVSGVVLFLDVEVNGMDHGLAQFRLVENELWATRSVLQGLGLRLDGAEAGGDELVSLATTFGDNLAYDAASQSLSIMVEPGRLAVATSRLNFYDEDHPIAESATGALVNYDIYANYADGQVTLDGVTETRVFSGNFLLENTGLFRLGNRGAGQATQFLRLDTSAAMTFPDRRLTLRVGDIVTRSTSLSRPSRIGGVRFGTDFALQPYLVTAPVPAFYGEATLPSTVDLYIDGIRRYSGEVAPGPFEIGSGPTRVNGAANAELVVTDVLGQVTRIDYPLYDTPLLLRRGLTDWSVEVGAVRRHYGLESFNYGQSLVASASLRRGLTNAITIEGHAELGAEFGNAGGGIVWAVPQWGVLTASAAASQGNDTTGHRLEVGYSYSNSRFNLAASMQRTSQSYIDIPASEGAAFPIERDIVSVGYNSDWLGSFGASLIRQRFPSEARRSYASATWNRALNDNFALSFSADVNLADTSERGVFATLTFVPGNRDHFRATVQANERRTTGAFGYRRSVPYEGGTGWAIDGSYGGNRFRGSAQVDHLGSFGQATAGTRIFGSNVSGYLGLSGSIVAMDGGFYSSRKIFDGFAVVSTSGVADVPVNLNNRKIGQTNVNGQLLITGLNAYQRNRVSIDTTNLPADIEVASVAQQAVPSLRTGVSVTFDLSPSHAVLLTLVDESGIPIAAGTMAGPEGSEPRSLMVGFDGQLFIDNPVPGSRILVEAENGPCRIELPPEFPENRAGRLGRMTCSRIG